jgi:uncharacterized protein with PIN domain
LGFDASYYTEGNYSSLIIHALRENRVILTRNLHLPKVSGVRIVTLSKEIVKEQISEALKRLQLYPDSAMMFTRCILCNQPLVAVAKETAKDRVPEYVFKTQEKFLSCPVCNRIYWKGTHWGNVGQALNEIASKQGEDKWNL